MTMGHEERRRIVIEDVKPEIDCGRFPIKRAIGEKVVIDPAYCYDTINVAAQQNNSNSLLWWMKHLISLTLPPLGILVFRRDDQ